MEMCKKKKVPGKGVVHQMELHAKVSLKGGGGRSWGEKEVKSSCD